MSDSQAGKKVFLKKPAGEKLRLQKNPHTHTSAGNLGCPMIWILAVDS